MTEPNHALEYAQECYKAFHENKPYVPRCYTCGTDQIFFGSDDCYVCKKCFDYQRSTLEAK